MDTDNALLSKPFYILTRCGTACVFTGSKRVIKTVHGHPDIADEDCDLRLCLSGMVEVIGIDVTLNTLYRAKLVLEPVKVWK